MIKYDVFDKIPIILTLNDLVNPIELNIRIRMSKLMIGEPSIYDKKYLYSLEKSDSIKIGKEVADYIASEESKDKKFIIISCVNEDSVRLIRDSLVNRGITCYTYISEKEGKSTKYLSMYRPKFYICSENDEPKPLTHKDIMIDTTPIMSINERFDHHILEDLVDDIELMRKIYRMVSSFYNNADPDTREACLSKMRDELYKIVTINKESEKYEETNMIMKVILGTMPISYLFFISCIFLYNSPFSIMELCGIMDYASNTDLESKDQNKGEEYMGTSVVYVNSYQSPYRDYREHPMSVWRFDISKYNKIPVLVLGDSFHQHDFLTDDFIKEHNVYIIRPKYKDEAVNIIKGLSFDNETNKYNLIVISMVDRNVYRGVSNFMEISNRLLENGIDVFTLDFEHSDYIKGRAVLRYFMSPCLYTLKGNIASFKPFYDSDYVVLGPMDISIQEVIKNMATMLKIYDKVYCRTYQDLYDDFYKFYMKLLDDYGVSSYNKDPGVKAMMAEIKKTKRIRYIYRFSTLFGSPGLVDKILSKVIYDFD